MKLILDEWIVREVIDTLYMARTTLLGITGLDSPQDVAKKSANETAITRRISKAIDIIQQPEQSSLPNHLEEAAHSYSESDEPLYSPGHRFHWDSDSLFGKQIETTFKAGAQWQKEQMMKSHLVSIGNTASEELQRINYENGKKDMREQMLKEAVEGEVINTNYPTQIQLNIFESSLKDGQKVKLIICKKED